MKAREVLSQALIEALDRAGKTAAEKSIDFDERVHRFRREVRRARGILRVFRPGIDDETRARLEELLRSAIAMTSALRDGAVLLRALHDLPLEEEAERARQRASDALEAIVAVADSTRRPEIILSQAAEGVLTVRMVFSGLTLSALGSSEVADSFRDLWRRAQRAREDVIITADRDDFHVWRKRTKELRYGFEVLEEAGANIDGLVRDMRLASRAQGLVTDGFLLRDALTDVDFSGVEEEAEELLETLNDLLTLGMREIIVDFGVPFDIEDQRIRRRIRRILQDGLHRGYDDDDDDDDD